MQGRPPNYDDYYPDYEEKTNFANYHMENFQAYTLVSNLGTLAARPTELVETIITIRIKETNVIELAFAGHLCCQAPRRAGRGSSWSSGMPGFSRYEQHDVRAVCRRPKMPIPVRLGTEVVKTNFNPSMNNEEAIY
ncbi:hypothetical protein HAX54_028250 [Datura stramonium]|uniref:Uncharacterized protein n=1 Tax=Datura stramonium TaxID=4076 RepID=A0ABS8V625_DATST|nr:hypothetical protein [Datura stramonium]